jgi:hypothetical protein
MGFLPFRPEKRKELFGVDRFDKLLTFKAFFLRLSTESNNFEF